MIKSLTRWIRERLSAASKIQTIGYENRLAKEIAVFNQVENIHALPKIFQYWAQRYLRPKFLEMGIRGVHEFFYDHMSGACAKSAVTQKFLSIGSGYSEIEVEVAKMLVGAGYTNFTLECMDVNQTMLQRAKKNADENHVGQYMGFSVCDATDWDPGEDDYGVVMAHQSLHHILNLEVLFDKVRKAIGKNGVFLTSDIIGRNGHMRWPEAMQQIENIWPHMPDRYKYNHALKRFEEMYENWDCSTEGFEGVRAQDILPLLSQYFYFEMFLGYGNLIDIFVDRAFGHNFDPESIEDRKFIDEVAMLDETLIEAGTLKPTHIAAVMRTGPVSRPRYYKHLTPEFCTRQI